MENVPPYIEFLLSPESYTHRVAATELIQTHISFVVIAGEYVYKWKKPVDFGFLDFSSLDKRKVFCQRELDLNRRLCPDIYLDIVSINQADGRYSLCGQGDAVEYGIKMVRMPKERMMTKVIEEGKLHKEHLDAIIEVLIPFYEKAESGDVIGEFGRAEAVAKNVLENFDQTKSFIGSCGLTQDMFDQIKGYSQTVLAETRRFDNRIAAGKVRDCHGDLHSGNICLADKVYVFDCIEFNERLRYLDVTADIAFLAMDLDFHGLAELSAYFISRFISRSGDEELLDMLNFYKCYRAYVRGKIGLFTAADQSVPAKAAKKCMEQAEKYFQLATLYTGGDLRK